MSLILPGCDTVIVNSATEHHPRRRRHGSSMLSKIRGRPVTGRLILRQDDYSTVVDPTIPSINCFSENLSHTCLSTGWHSSGGLLHPYSAYSHGSTGSSSSFFSSSEPSLTFSESSWTSYGSSSAASTHVNVKEVCPDPVVRDDQTWYGYDGESQYDYDYDHDYEYVDGRKESQSRRYKKTIPLSPRPQYYIEDYQQSRRASDAYYGKRRWDALTETRSRRSGSPRSEDVYSERESSEADYAHHQDYYRSSPSYSNTQLQRVPVSHNLNKPKANNTAVIPAVPAPQGTIRVGGLVVHAGHPAKRNSPHPHQQQQLLLQQRSQGPPRSQFFGWEDLCDASDVESGIDINLYYDDGDDLDDDLDYDGEVFPEKYERAEEEQRVLGSCDRRERYQQQQQLASPPPQRQLPPLSPPHSQKRIQAAAAAAYQQQQQQLPQQSPRYDPVGRTSPAHDYDDDRSLLHVGDSCSVLAFRGYPPVHSPGSGNSGSGSCETCGGMGCKRRLAALEGLEREYRERKEREKEREERARERERRESESERRERRERERERERWERERESERGGWANESRGRTRTRTGE